jgi:hypothetical protein
MGMTATAAKTAIKNKLASVLPALLAAESLDDFDEYLDSQPSDVEKMQIGIYVDEEMDTEDDHILSLLIQAQLYRKADWTQQYHSVLMATIREHITADLVGFMSRDQITADLWPVDQRSTSYSYYEIRFSEPLDDCD